MTVTRLFYDWVTDNVYEVIVKVEDARQEKHWK